MPLPQRMGRIGIALVFFLFGGSVALAQKTFLGVPCTKDCSGHQAGYAWAQKKSITHLDQCRGRSRSFVEGCLSWVAHHSAQPPSASQFSDKNSAMPAPGAYGN